MKIERGFLRIGGDEMEALIELDSEFNFEVELKRSTTDGIMILSKFKILLEDIQGMIDIAFQNNTRFIPVSFNLAEDEDDFFSTLESRGLNKNIQVKLISNLDGFYFEIGNETLKASVVYGPIRFKMIEKIIDLSWPVEVYLPIYSEEDEEEEGEKEPIIDSNENDAELMTNFKKMTPEEQNNLMKLLEEQEKRGEI